MTKPRGVGLTASGAAPANSPRTRPAAAQSIASTQVTDDQVTAARSRRGEVIFTDKSCAR